MQDADYIRELMRISERIVDPPTPVVSKKTGRVILSTRQLRRKAMLELKQEVARFRSTQTKN